MKVRKEIRVTGIGGQGAITVGHILGRAAAIFDGKEVAMTEGYSPYITGGWSRADVVISDEAIDYPMVTKLDSLLTMYQDGLDLNAKMVKAGGTILVEKQLVDPTRAKSEGRILAIPAMKEAAALGKKVVTNIVMLGALAEVTPAVSRESLESALKERFPKAAELNVKALNSGSRLAREGLEGGDAR